MNVSPLMINEYHVFVASPSDMDAERKAVRKFFNEYNQSTARLWGVRFEVVDSESYATIGVGRPQELITKQTLETFKDSLALVIGLMGQRFGSPTGVAESGTEEEFNWAFESNQSKGFPEIKWFFRKFETIVVSEDPEAAEIALEQWRKVREFRKRIKETKPPLFCKEYESPDDFANVLRTDLTRWLTHKDRPWVVTKSEEKGEKPEALYPLLEYYNRLYQEFHRLDIAGIDSDRAFEIPLTDIYVRLRVIFSEIEEEGDKEEFHDDSAIDIKAALESYNRLVIVGDPGSGKSTFIKYIALMIARSIIESDPLIALESLNIESPLPVPILVSCWDFSDFLKKYTDINLEMLISFIVYRLGNLGYSICDDDLIKLLETGDCCLMFDGLDEVPTEKGRAIVSRLFEECVKKYEKNRYVVTSRVRAYTGDTILKEGFTRCDIQPFNEEDRRQFIRNWVALLFQKNIEEVLESGSEARYEFESLTHGIESNERIKALALNPLLLTVIAIVHWNRKRLPEQRVDLYDECVDVLLGQRKEAEHTQLVRKIAAFDEKREEEEYRSRSWIRKRFAEIALQILLSTGEDITKADLVQLLTPRFRDRKASTDETAAIQAELFLDRQELRSGLIVSRRENSYRFVHLTFQEYLAAWHLSKQEFDEVINIIQPHLREQKWFETLQLLGGEWAKGSDELVDKYINWLLTNRGRSISEQAPVVALCANIVNDITGNAEIKAATRQLYESVIGKTLRAFRSGSGVSEKTQLEILEALAKLGPAAKDHLITATKASYYPIRSRAINLLIPYLSDEDLFGMSHILVDLSKRPIRAYLFALWARDPVRTIRLLEDRHILEYRTKYHRAIQALAYLLAIADDYLEKSQFLKSCWEMIWETNASVVEGGPARSTLLKTLVRLYPDDEQTWERVRKMAEEDYSVGVRIDAMEFLMKYRRDDEETWNTLIETAKESNRYAYWSSRNFAVGCLVSLLPDEIDKIILMRSERMTLPWYRRERIRKSKLIKNLTKHLSMSKKDVEEKYDMLCKKMPGVLSVDE